MRNITKNLWMAGGLLCVLTTAFLTGCGPNEKEIQSRASEALEHRNFQSALKTILELKDSRIEENDSLLLLLSEAYYGLTGGNNSILGEGVCDMDFSPDGKSVVFTDLKNGKLYFYEYPELRYKKEIEMPAPCYGADFSPNGNHIAVALSNMLINIYDVESGKLIKSLEGHSNRARAVAYIDSLHLFSGGNDQYLITWDGNTGKLLDKQWRHRKNLKSIRRSVDGNYLVSASNDGTAIIWDFKDKSQGKEKTKVIHGRNYVNDAMLSPDNSILVTASGDGDVKIWNASSGTVNHIIPLEDVGCSVDFTPDGKRVIIGGYTAVHFIDPESGKVVEKYPVSNDPVWSVRFLDNNHFAFIDATHFYEGGLLQGKELIEKSREWLEAHKD